MHFRPLQSTFHKLRLLLTCRGKQNKLSKKAFNLTSIDLPTYYYTKLTQNGSRFEINKVLGRIVDQDWKFFSITRFDWILTAFWLLFGLILTAFWILFGFILTAFWLNFDWILKFWLNFDWFWLILTDFDWFWLNFDWKFT